MGWFLPFAIGWFLAPRNVGVVQATKEQIEEERKRQESWLARESKITNMDKSIISSPNIEAS